ncbi:hypothetical protein [Anabaena sp. CCY 9910]
MLLAIAGRSVRAELISNRFALSSQDVWRYQKQACALVNPPVCSCEV